MGRKRVRGCECGARGVSVGKERGDECGREVSVGREREREVSGDEKERGVSVVREIEG